MLKGSHDGFLESGAHVAQECDKVQGLIGERRHDGEESSLSIPSEAVMRFYTATALVWQRLPPYHQGSVVSPVALDQGQEIE